MKNLKVWLAFELMDVISHFLLFTFPSILYPFLRRDTLSLCFSLYT